MRSRYRLPAPGSLAEEATQARGRRPVVIVADRGDGAATTAALLGVHAPAAGVVTVHPTPGAVSATGLAADVLAALGLGVERTTRESVSGLETASRAVRAWLLADRVEFLIVLRAHLLSGRAVAWLLWLRRATTVRLVLVWHSSAPIGWDGVTATALVHRAMSVTRLIEQLPRAALAAPAPVHDLARVPDSEADRFLSDAETRMEAKAFARVRAEFEAGRAHAATWTERHGDAGPARGAPAAPGGTGNDMALGERMLAMLARRDSQLRALRAQRHSAGLAAARADWHRVFGLYRFLGHLVADSPGMQTTITRLRGAQAALGERGLELRLPANLAYMVGYAMTTTPLDAALIARIRARVANPVHAAALVVALCSGARPTELSQIGHTGFTGEEIVVAPGLVRSMADVCVWAVPPAARPVVEAALTFVRSAPDPGFRLLADGAGARGAMLAEIHRVTGVPIPARHPWSRGWMWQAGMLALGYTG